MSLFNTSRYNSRQFINKAEWLRQIPTDICKLVRSKLINSISLITEITFSKKPRKSYTECNVAFSQLELGSVYLLVCLSWSYMFRMFFLRCSPPFCDIFQVWKAIYGSSETLQRWLHLCGVKNITKKWKQDFADAVNFSASFINKPSLLLYRKDRQHKQYFIFER